MRSRFTAHQKSLFFQQVPPKHLKSKLANSLPKKEAVVEAAPDEALVVKKVADVAVVALLKIKEVLELAAPQKVNQLLDPQPPKQLPPELQLVLLLNATMIAVMAGIMIVTNLAPAQAVLTLAEPEIEATEVEEARVILLCAYWVLSCYF